jgi:hypothetical protein
MRAAGVSGEFVLSVWRDEEEAGYREIFLHRAEGIG